MLSSMTGAGCLPASKLLALVASNPEMGIIRNAPARLDAFRGVLQPDTGSPGSLVCVEEHPDVLRDPAGLRESGSQADI